MIHFLGQLAFNYMDIVGRHYHSDGNLSTSK